MIELVYTLHVKFGVAHMDIKVDNIVISDNGSLVLIDFELLKGLEEELAVPMGTKEYFPPEVHSINKF